MLGIGFPELIIIAVIALLIFGPSKLPELGKTLGKGLREFKKASSDFKEQINPLNDIHENELDNHHDYETNTESPNLIENKAKETKKIGKPIKRRTAVKNKKTQTKVASDNNSSKIKTKTTATKKSSKNNSKKSATGQRNA